MQDEINILHEKRDKSKKAQHTTIGNKQHAAEHNKKRNLQNVTKH